MKINVQAKSVYTIPAILVALMIILAGNVDDARPDRQGSHQRAKRRHNDSADRSTHPNSLSCSRRIRKWTRYKAS